MGVLERRERERLDVRNRILDAARELFAREGTDRVTMRALAEAIEYSPTAIYYHFKDKQELLDSLCREDFGRLLEAFHAASSPTDPVERIRAIGRAYARFGLDHPNHYRFLFMNPESFAERTLPNDQEETHPGESAYGLLHGAVVDALAAGRFRSINSHAAAQVLWSSMHGVVSLLITLPSPFWPMQPAVDDLVEQAIQNAVIGLMAAPGTTDRPAGPARSRAGQRPGVRERGRRS